ncbi:GSCOCG00002128001-RA-CDS [Cotesia congregata]|uniref:somatomedin-B and thrombospondin type-1 domain-containing protein-like n=1 Tax=Cotesia glomerata TaxID=32391 RepID=UPI001759A8AC|nr:somatomedin-B and thrombospondin type-1 domain-containing protein-like [Cotesia glomerata]CAD6237075.1 GSCOCG00002128001-RA-CDS [Cotesia congregata]
MDRLSGLLELIFFLVSIIVTNNLINPSLASSCHKSNRCCPSDGVNCAVTGPSMAPIFHSHHHRNNYTEKPCYCHYSCLKHGDCCPGFKQACNVHDCIGSEWGPWSACNNKCGRGIQKRSRKIERPAENGGKGCNPLVQRRYCYSTQCDKHDPEIALRETAYILPAELSAARHKVTNNDIIRANLRLRKQLFPSLGDTDWSPYNVSKEYCVTFSITKASQKCTKKSGQSELSEGSTVCVKCETTAFIPSLDYRCRGDGGTEGMITRWSLFSEPYCYGKWQRTVKTGSECDASVCQPKPHYIFV